MPKGKRNLPMTEDDIKYLKLVREHIKRNWTPEQKAEAKKKAEEYWTPARKQLESERAQDTWTIELKLQESERVSKVWKDPELGPKQATLIKEAMQRDDVKEHLREVNVEKMKVEHEERKLKAREEIKEVLRKVEEDAKRNANPK